MAAGSVRNRTGAADEAGIVQRPEPIGRGDRARQRVLTAALDQLADGGSAGFTMEAIARRAGASKATLYRHWPSAPALLVEAMGGTFPPFPPPATGDLRSDLVTLLTDLAALLDGPRFPRLMAAIIDLAERDPALADLHADLTAAHRRPALEVLRHGQHEEQIPPGADLELLLDQFDRPVLLSQADRPSGHPAVNGRGNRRPVPGPPPRQTRRRRDGPTTHPEPSPAQADGAITASAMIARTSAAPVTDRLTGDPSAAIRSHDGVDDCRWMFRAGWSCRDGRARATAKQRLPGWWRPVGCVPSTRAARPQRG